MTDDHPTHDSASVVPSTDEELTRYRLDILLYYGPGERSEGIEAWLARYGHDPDGVEQEREALVAAGLLERRPDRTLPYRPSSAGSSILRRRAQQYQFTFETPSAAAIESVLERGAE